MKDSLPHFRRKDAVFWQFIAGKNLSCCRFFFFFGGGGGAESEERIAPGEEVLALIPAVATAPFWFGVSLMLPAETEVMVSLLCLMCGGT